MMAVVAVAGSVRRNRVAFGGVVIGLVFGLSIGRGRVRFSVMAVVTVSRFALIIIVLGVAVRFVSL